ncbi:uncharacterized protein LOC143575017 [Bidens hawaiensis]|uniref:uncharacterized protein LOC143575017 n=1 Tax=Bidens hawaiensis TaxID=980011 RepID=UPI0040496877
MASESKPEGTALVVGEETKKRKKYAKELILGVENRVEEMETSLVEYKTHVDALQAEFDIFKEHTNESLQKVEPLSIDVVELEGNFRAALAIMRNEMKEMIMHELGQLKTNMENIEKELAVCHDFYKTLQGEVNVLKMAVGNGVAGTSNSTSSKVKVPQPTPFVGKQKARAVDNFLWEVDQYFKGVDIGDAAKKISTTTLYLKDTAALSWRRKSKEIEQGTCTITTWADFIKEFKRQFYPENTQYKARICLRNLKQKGAIKDYIDDFTTLILEIPDIMPGKRWQTSWMAYNIGLKMRSNVETFKTYHQSSLRPSPYTIGVRLVHQGTTLSTKTTLRLGEPDPTTPNFGKRKLGNDSKLPTNLIIKGVLYAMGRIIHATRPKKNSLNAVVKVNEEPNETEEVLLGAMQLQILNAMRETSGKRLHMADSNPQINTNTEGKGLRFVTIEIMEDVRKH